MGSRVRAVSPEQAAAVCRGESGRSFEQAPPRELRDFMPPSAPMLSGAGGLRIMLGFPGLIERFDVVVPGSHLTRVGARDELAVSCTCGGEPGGASLTPLPVNAIVPCEDECGRYFLRTGDDVVLCARFSLEDVV